MVVYSHLHGQTPLFRVGGSEAPAQGAKKALKLAHELHGGRCYYCKDEVEKKQATIDHVSPRASGGTEDLQNLVIACKPCNSKKAGRPIELFKPDAGREWLSAVLAQVQDRLNRL